MADQNLHWGSPIGLWAGQNTGDTATILDANDERVALIFQFNSILNSEAITHVGYYLATKNGTPSCKIGFQGITTGGVPDDVWSTGTGGEASATFTPGTAGTFEWIALDFPITLSRGVPYCVVLYMVNVNGGTGVTAAGTLGAMTGRQGQPYALTRLGGGAWAKQTGAPYKFGVKSASNVYQFPMVNSFLTVTRGAADTFGYAFRVPSTLLGSGATFTIKGFRYRGRHSSSATANTWKMLLHYDAAYAGSGTYAPNKIAVSVPMDPDLMNNSLTDATIELYFDSNNLPTLSVDTWYMIELGGQDASSVIVDTCTVTAQNDWNAWAANDNVAYSTRTSIAGGYAAIETSATTFAALTRTQRIIGEVIFGTITPPAGGSGGGLRLAGHGGLAA